jgi:hypothetical protein
VEERPRSAEQAPKLSRYEEAQILELERRMEGEALQARFYESGIKMFEEASRAFRAWASVIPAVQEFFSGEVSGLY